MIGQMKEESKKQEGKKIGKKFFLGALLAFLLVGGLGAYFAFGRSSDRSLSGDFPEMEGGEASQISDKKSLRDLLGLGRSQKCTYSEPESGSSGTVYVSGNESRADFAYKLPDGAEQVSHMIIKEDKMYLWIEGEETGYLMSLSEDEDGQESEGEAQAPETVDLDQAIDYRCEDWSVDDSKFTLPAGVEFKDLSALIEFEAPEAGETGSLEESDSPADACVVCDSLPVEAQEQCRESLNCE